MKKIKLWINGREVRAEKGTNILEAALSAGFEIPSLCYLKGVSAPGTCRVCLVEAEKNRSRCLVASCVTPVEEGVKVFTNTPSVRHARRRMVELLLSEHRRECTSCVRNLNCELQNLADRMRLRKVKFEGERIEHKIDDKNAAVVRDYDKCIKCRRCEAVCKYIQGVGALAPLHRGFKTVIAPAFMKNLSEVDCINCGQCILACPTGALTEKESIEEVFKALDDPDKFVVVQTAPSIRVTLGESFGMPGGSGGLTEAAVRTAFALVNPGSREPVMELKELRGTRGIREATIDLKKGGKLKVAVVHGTRNARRILERVKRGEHFDFIEIMACPGGCIGGGGQPITGKPELSAEQRLKRAKALYKIDLSKELRKAHENPAVKKVYEEFLGYPLSKKAKELLHTSYIARGRKPASRVFKNKQAAGGRQTVRPAKLVFSTPQKLRRGEGA